MKIGLTGGASGIGAAVAAELKVDGHHVTAFDISEPQENVDRWVETDLSAPASIKAAIDAADGPSDALINTAGFCHRIWRQNGPKCCARWPAGFAKRNRIRHRFPGLAHQLLDQRAGYRHRRRHERNCDQRGAGALSRTRRWHRSATAIDFHRRFCLPKTDDQHERKMRLWKTL